MAATICKSLRLNRTRAGKRHGAATPGQKSPRFSIGDMLPINESPAAVNAGLDLEHRRTSHLRHQLNGVKDDLWSQPLKLLQSDAQEEITAEHGHGITPLHIHRRSSAPGRARID